MKTLFVGPLRRCNQLELQRKEKFIFCGLDPARLEGYQGEVHVILSGRIHTDMLDAVHRLLDATIERID